MATRLGISPVSELCGARVVSLPFYPAMSDEDVDRVIETVLGELMVNNE
ncbi:MAG: DegT/DnrJ/EryC1/StrS family aminotransferase [Bacteroidia bacterium]